MKPTFLLVPGAWHLPAYFDPLIDYLSSHGYFSVAVPLPSVNSSPAVTSLQPDVIAVADALTSLLDGGEDVVVVMHSYGGMVGTDAVGKVVQELSTVPNGSHGNRSTAKLRRLVYVAAWVPLEGQSSRDAMQRPVEGPPRPPPEYLSFEVIGTSISLCYSRGIFDPYADTSSHRTSR
jgi:pimeloyl-ACP methyl ester carboxylesterase